MIYHVEGIQPYSALTAALFDWAGDMGISLVLSTLIWTEMLAKPFKEGNQEAIGRVETFLRSIPKALWLPLDEEVAKEAARIRGVYNLRAPDAIVVATSLVGRATTLVTNDADMKRVGREGLKIFVLKEFVCP